jgi:hypothetical protein
LIDIKDKADLLDSLKEPTTIDTAPIGYTGGVEVQAKSGVITNFIKDLVLVVPQESHDALTALVLQTNALKIAASEWPDKVQKALDGADELEQAELVDAAKNDLISKLRSNQDLFRKAADPPDANYTQVIDSADVAKQSAAYVGPGFLEQRANSATRAASLTAAISTSYDRLAGAQLANDADWQARQLAAIANLNASAALGASQIIALDELNEIRASALR